MTAGVSPVALGCVVRRGLASWVLTESGLGKLEVIGYGLFEERKSLKVEGLKV